jgi:enoyl-CoA hydratase/carnithine racemase
MLAELAAALRGVQGDPDVRVVELTGTGTVFCSGADLGERLDPPAASRGQPSLPEVLSMLVELDQPVVARVNGHARAGGLGLVAACDLAVAPSTATFAFAEVRVGVAPAVIAVPALRVMDRRSFARYSLTGDVFGAAEAVTAGLLTATVDAAALDDWVAGAVASFLRSSPPAVAATKRLMEDIVGRSRQEAMASAAALSDEMFRSPGAAEGMAAFLEKRLPSWVEEPG